MMNDNETIREDIYPENKQSVTLRRNILIPSNTILESAPTHTRYIEKHFELMIGIGRNHHCKLVISESALRAINHLEPETSIY